MTNKILGSLKNIKNKDKLILAVGFLLFAYLIKYGTWKVVNIVMHSQLEFTEGSYHFRMWRTNTHPYRVEFYIYNWTNSADIANKLIKPRFEEVGPYHFDLYINRTGIRIHSNESITYSFTKRFIHVKTSNSRGLDDVITTLNPVANALAYQTRNWTPFAKLAASFALRATKSALVVRKTVAELLFEGYKDPLLEFIRQMPGFATSGLGIDLKDKFGYFYKRNYTDFYFGPYNVHVTQDSSYGNLHTIKGATHTPYFPDECGRVTGKLGEFADPNHDRNQPVIVYVHDLNVFIDNHFIEERHFYDVLGTVYAPKNYIFDNGYFHEENKCFCQGECIPMGMLNSSATFNAPVFMSLPHFMLADQSYQNAVEIIRRDNSSGMPYIAIEPYTGLLLEGALNIQLNLLLQPVKGLGLFANVPRVFLPVFSMKQHVVAKGGYLTVLAWLQTLPHVINCISLILLLVAVGVVLFLFYASPKPNPRDVFRGEYRQVQVRQ